MNEFSQKEMVNNFLELVRRASAEMPGDVISALERAQDAEIAGSPARNTLTLMLENIVSAKEGSVPLCQDTGTIIAYIDYWRELDADNIKKAFEEAVREATRKSYLRPNTVHPITGKNAGDNTGEGAPFFHLNPINSREIKVRLMLKGGGSENVSAQYSLPDRRLNAGRDTDGIRKTILDAVVQAQGMGCPPGTLGIGIGGDRMSSYITAKEQLFRKLDDKNPDKEIADLETQLLKEINSLGIGPMGYGGKTTVLGVKIGMRMRHPASFFVSIAYMCWSYRKKQLVWNEKGVSIGDI